MHEDHRQRVYERYIQEGLEHFQPYEVLELLLFFSQSRGDTNVTGHQLIDRFGSITGVFNAHPLDLQKVPGIGPKSAVLLSMFPALLRMYGAINEQNSFSVGNAKEATQYIVNLCKGRLRERCYLISLDHQCRHISTVLLHEGLINEVNVHPRTLVETALRYNASQVILVHNHPGGQAVPSKEDDAFTRRVGTALAILSIPLVDHFVVSGDKAYSYHRENRMQDINHEITARIAQGVRMYGQT